MTREEAVEVYNGLINEKIKEAFEFFAPELRESEDERIRKGLIEALKTSKTVGELKFILPEPTREECIAYLEKQTEQKPIKMEVYEVGKGTTICGQDYKCKKDYKKGNCWYIKDVIYHCSRDGYLTDQNGVSWSCTPEWFKEYIYTNSEWADKEKNDFVSGQFLQCKLSFEGFKEGEHYWLEYVGDDMYVGRSDNILNQKFHITPRQLYTLFSQQLEEVQGPPQKERQVSSEYETPMFEETPSDEQIIDALINHLNEQDGFLTAINCVSTKAILNWLEKQKEQKPMNNPKWNELTWQDINELEEIINHVHYEFRNGISAEGFGKEVLEQFRNMKEDAEVDACEQKPAEWSEEDETKLRDVIRLVEDSGHVKSIREHYEKFLTSLPERFNLRPEQWSEEDEKIMQTIIKEGDLKPSEIAWLKSLRPSWKPSKEQIGLLGKVYNLIWADPATPADVQDGLGDFIEQLRTL